MYKKFYKSYNHKTKVYLYSNSYILKENYRLLFISLAPMRHIHMLLFKNLFIMRRHTDLWRLIFDGLNRSGGGVDSATPYY